MQLGVDFHFLGTGLPVLFVDDGHFAFETAREDGFVGEGGGIEAEAADFGGRFAATVRANVGCQGPELGGRGG